MPDIREQITVKECPRKFRDKERSDVNEILERLVRKSEQHAGGVDTAAGCDTGLDYQKELYMAELMHDLKNPLLSQLSGLNMLIKGTFGDMNERQKEILSLITESVSFLNDMVYSALDVYKFENGNIALNRKIFDVHKLVSVCINELKFASEEKNVEFVLTSDENEIYLDADSSLIRRIITNLCVNAVKYSFRETKIYIDIFSEQNNFIFGIKNTGEVVKEETKRHIFDKFTSGYAKGNGLGLYFCKTAAKAHGGDLFFESEGNNTEFLLVLPCKVSLNEKLLC